MPARGITVALTAAALAAGLTACGSDTSNYDVQPKSTPPLIAPASVDLGASSSTDTTSTTSTTATTTTPTTTGAAPSSGAGTGGATATPAPATGGTGATGGAGATGGTPTTPATGNTGGADPGGFSDFCAQNPGACPGQ